MPVAVITAVDPVLREALVASLLLDVDGAVVLRYEIAPRSGALRRVIAGADGVHEDELLRLEHPCVSCAMREDAVPSLARLAHLPGVTGILLAPPISADPSIVAGTLRPHQDDWHLAPGLAVLSARTAREDLLGEDTLAERGLQWASGDERSVGEALAAQLEYSDRIVLTEDAAAAGDTDGAGESAAGAELVEHLRAPEQQRVMGLYSLNGAQALEGRTDHLLALRRRDVRYVEPHGGPSQHGTWTLDLSSAHPLHPRRLLEHIEELGGGRLRSRGRFWVPDRPDSICQWDGTGGQVSIGAVWKAGRDLPTTRLVVTGVEEGDLARVRDAFARSLLTPQEWEAGLGPWLGAEDTLAPWLGVRDAAA